MRLQMSESLSKYEPHKFNQIYKMSRKIKKTISKTVNAEQAGVSYTHSRSVFNLSLGVSLSKSMYKVYNFSKLVHPLSKFKGALVSKNNFSQMTKCTHAKIQRVPWSKSMKSDDYIKNFSGNTTLHQEYKLNHNT